MFLSSHVASHIFKCSPRRYSLTFGSNESKTIQPPGETGGWTMPTNGSDSGDGLERHRNHDLDRNPAVGALFRRHRRLQELEAVLEMRLLQSLLNHLAVRLKRRRVDAQFGRGMIPLDVDVNVVGGAFRQYRGQDRLHHAEKRDLHGAVQLQVVFRTGDSELDVFEAAQL